MPKTSGYTLIELLIVISIISVLGIVGFVNYKSFSSDQVVVKAAGQIQTVLRLAQSNATTSTLCSDGQHSGPWLVVFNQTSLFLACGSSSALERTYNLETAETNSILGSSSCSIIVPSVTSPFTISFFPPDPENPTSAGLTFSYSGATATCLGSSTWTFTVRNTKDITKTTVFKLSKGGAIDVQ